MDYILILLFLFYMFLTFRLVILDLNANKRRKIVYPISSNVNIQMIYSCIKENANSNKIEKIIIDLENKLTVYTKKCKFEITINDNGLKIYESLQLRTIGLGFLFRLWPRLILHKEAKMLIPILLDSMNKIILQKETA